MSYESWDAIADAYVPCLALLALFGVVYSPRPKPMRSLLWEGLTRFLALILLVVLVYGWMFLDKALGIWPAFGLDYSTHTALAFVLVLFLFYRGQRFRIGLSVSFAAYILLMLYQRYHSVLDIVTTMIVLALSIAIAWFAGSKMGLGCVQVRFKRAN